ncbi:MAG: ABC transporter substrate-binding protein [Oscillospiraceae bacterium]|jgi:sn-glycerol 3-phosphate transport system substrate-binding protein
MSKRTVALLLALVLSISLFTACSSSSPSSPAPQSSSAGESSSAAPPQTTADTSAGKVKIIFWHAMGGRNGEYLDKMVANYNASQDAVEVEAQYQGNYDDAMAKLRATPAGSGPDIMQLYDIGTRWMIDNGNIHKMQDFIDADNYDISDYEPNILAYYALDGGTLYSMPFNCSSPVIVYNKEALAAANLDPATAFATMDDCLNTAKAIADAGLQVGGSFTNYSWVFEQLISMQELELVDNGNGRMDRATKVIMDENNAAINILSKWKTIADAPFTQTYGKGTNESKQQFATGNVGFILDSCSVYVDVSAAAGGTFTVGFAPVPKVNAGDTGGVSVGGGSLWLMDNGDDNKAAAAWDFIKFVTSAEEQAKWSMGTGYLPIRKSALELDFYKDYLTNTNPELIVAIEALQNSKPNCAGAVMGVFPQARVIIENAIETMINDSSVTPESVVQTMCEGINAEIEMYNRTN